MIVMKFGGTSVGSVEAIRRVFGIVHSRLDRRPVVVVSAHAGVTNALLDLGRRAPAGDTDCSAVAARHRDILTGLGLAGDLLDPLLAELADLVRGMRLVGEASPRALDYLASFGERCSARTIAAFFSAEGLVAEAVDAFDAGLRTDSGFGRARPRPDHGEIRQHLASIRALPIVTGFIAADEHGNITTLGRNGSDFSAALFGNALDAEEIQIWTDVDGVMTADPTVVPAARRIEAMSFDEASELAYYGGKVLHPATLLPAMAKSIPVRVLNTHRPDIPGTLILPEFDDPEATVRSIVYKDGIHLVTVVTPRMLQQHGYLAKVFGLAAEHRVDIDLVATSEVSVTMTVDDATRLGAFVAALRDLGDVTVEDRHTLLCIVGHGIAKSRGIAARMLSTLADEGIGVRVISQGAIKVNVATIVAEADRSRAIAALHRQFFEE